MFDSKTTLTGRLTDAVDLLIDFATLGEYGMEPAERPGATCESRHRRQTRPGTRHRGESRGRGVAVRASEPGQAESPPPAGAGMAPSARSERSWPWVSKKPANGVETQTSPTEVGLELLNKEPAATYSPRGLPPKYHRRRVA
jgi:hypothetical protein